MIDLYLPENTFVFVERLFSIMSFVIWKRKNFFMALPKLSLLLSVF